MMVSSTLVSVLLVVGFGLVTSSPLARDKRQAGQCDDNIPNVCTEDHYTHSVKLPHPTDQHKFLQCANGRRMFVIQCPAGEVYHPATTECAVQVSQSAIQPPGVPTNPRNKCTQENINSGHIFYANPNDNTTFYECVKVGLVMPLRCPSHLVFDQSLQKCSLPAGTVLGSGSAILLSPGAPGNPCTPEAIASLQLYFSYPDPAKYYQCDLGGYAHIMTCPNNLIWNLSKEQCDSRYPQPGDSLMG